MEMLGIYTMRKLTSSPYAAVFTGMVVLLGAYVGSYLLLVQPIASIRSHGPGPLRGKAPNYRFGGHVAVVIFQPIERIDRRIRPRTWQYP